MGFEYFRSEEAEQFSFFRIPKALFTEKKFDGLSTDAKLLYGILLDRISLSKKNGWIDDEGKVYIIYTLSELQQTLRASHTTVTKLLYELDSFHGIGLIERYRQGCNRPSIIYVKNFVSRTRDRPNGVQENGNPECRKLEVRSERNWKSGAQETGSPDCKNLEVNNTNKSKTDNNDTDRSERAATPAMESSPYSGRFGNVKLSPEEYRELGSLYPRGHKKMIDHLSSYMRSTGKTYRDHFATLILWAERDGVSSGERKYECEEGECL
jgi:hypothetical protein